MPVTSISDKNLEKLYDQLNLRQSYIRQIRLAAINMIDVMVSGNPEKQIEKQKYFRIGIRIIFSIKYEFNRNAIIPSDDTIAESTFEPSRQNHIDTVVYFINKEHFVYKILQSNRMNKEVGLI
ncbi:UNKNOWN [Stylonychia lemnae]|uniref:Uncharacterized protein n=1 Tax=Stylonychia lemnae TaxID=5949 RepID=A0A077ZTB4_STYLE|nr:UNKNOWN [Stylonychia lemnae]|eukprot:CDW73122.1 UNKNOWN [Stylonychia lemnae]